MAHTSIQHAASTTHQPLSGVVNQIAIYFLLVTAFITLPTSAAYAGGGDPLSTTLCTVVGWFTGGMGRSIATLGIVVLGIGALLGKVSWQMAITVALGVAVMFSGAKVVNLLTNQNASFCEGQTGFDAGMIETVLCNLVALSQGPAGRALATLGVIFLGITALMGKVSAGVALILVVGIGTIFNADGIGRTLVEAAGGSWMGCSPTP